MLEGEVRYHGEGWAILFAGGVGYKVFAPRATLTSLKEGTSACIYTYLAVRETALDLYGFPTPRDLSFFELLLSVPGIGPKSALAILDLAPVETLISAIASGKAAYLTGVSGIGKKTAEKIVLELQGKVVPTAPAEETMHDEEALAALCTLGYTESEARTALRAVPASVSGAAARVREALRTISR